MKRIRKVFVMILAASLMLVFTACGSSTAESGSEETAEEVSDTIKVAYCAVANADRAPWAGLLWDDIESMCEDRGWEFIGRSAEGIPANQSALVKELLDEDPDYFILFAGDSINSASWVREIHKAGVPLIMASIDARDSESEYVASFVGPDQEAMAAQLAFDMIEKNGADAGLNIVCISGVEAQEDYKLREAGFEKTIEHYSDYNILATGYANAEPENAKSLMEDYIRYYDDIDVLMCYGDDYASGAIEALQEAGMDDVQIYTISGDNEIIQLIADGVVEETVINDPALIANGCALVITGLESGEIPQHYIYTELTYIDQSNAAEWIGMGLF